MLAARDIVLHGDEQTRKMIFCPQPEDLDHEKVLTSKQDTGLHVKKARNLPEQRACREESGYDDESSQSCQSSRQGVQHCPQLP